jgi:hypothetical protein
MNRILEFTPSQEEAVVSRILVLVHQAVDDHFPTAGHANRQFTKTVFSAEGEPTAGLKVPHDDGAGDDRRSAFADSEDTSPMGRPAEGPGAPPVPPAPGVVPPPPPVRAVGRDDGRGGRQEAPRPAAVAPANPAPDQSSPSRATGLESTMQGIRNAHSPDWVTRITLALLLAGLVLLAYVLFA